MQSFGLRGGSRGHPRPSRILARPSPSSCFRGGNRLAPPFLLLPRQSTWSQSSCNDLFNVAVHTHSARLFESHACAAFVGLTR